MERNLNNFSPTIVKENIDINSNHRYVKEKNNEDSEMSINEMDVYVDKKEQSDMLMEKIRIKSIDIMFNILTLTPSKLKII